MSQAMPDELRRRDALEHLTDSEYHRLLSAERRRTTLTVVAELSTPVELETLAEAVAARESDAGTSSSEHVDRVAAALHHVHLPKMAEFDIIGYDPDARRIESRR